MTSMRPPPRSAENHSSARPLALAERARLDDRAGHAEVAHEVGDADDRRDHRDEAEVARVEQAREHAWSRRAG